MIYEDGRRTSGESIWLDRTGARCVAVHLCVRVAAARREGPHSCLCVCVRERDLVCACVRVLCVYMHTRGLWVGLSGND